MLTIGLNHTQKTELKYVLLVVHFPKPALSNVVSLKGLYWVLGPLLFLLYINDLPDCLTNSYPRMYADDTHLTHADKDLNIIQSCLNEDLLNISKWLIANKLTLNMTETEFMLIGSKQKLNALTASPVLSINGSPVNQVSTSKSLGVLIDANLTWGSHIEKLAEKNASGIAAIKRVRQFVPQQHCILSTKP